MASVTVLNTSRYASTCAPGLLHPHLAKGEYAAISTNPNDIFGSPSDGRLLWSTMPSASSIVLAVRPADVGNVGSVGEAAFMTGLERNSDIVFAASYAPTLQVCLKSRLMIIS